MKHHEMAKAIEPKFSNILDDFHGVLRKHGIQDVSITSVAFTPKDSSSGAQPSFLRTSACPEGTVENTVCVPTPHGVVCHTTCVPDDQG
jgi:hypothetical protein